MPKKKSRENRPTFKTKGAALKHGHITYGETKTGGRKFRVYPTKAGWNVSKRK